MLIGACAVLLGVAFHLLGAWVSARQNDRHSMSAASGRFAAWLSQWTRGLQTAGWILSIIGALAFGDAMSTSPGVSIAVVVAVLALVNGLPSLIVTLLHRRTARG
ncbi:hypothetical protein ERC79_20790 [Rhodococcus sp. ABRD24]|uniref:hypothetical protein n=1 Tax=Rhodococcus sp. ABRD24 TaxID=2507582 RepID=UPI001038B4A7|nr:hypothetical protein [Rhodococcus sp. ABRD24]QBJ98106.1 hypothetical protein ERC79_20790 [Rhodococcus sp. ABRD24]